MAPKAVTDLVAFLKDHSDNLRSVAHYSEDQRELVYVRDDVAKEYTDEEVDEVFNHLWMEAFGKPVQEDVYSHTDLRCLVSHFGDAVEMNFLLGDHTGVAVAFDADAFATQQLFVMHCREILDSQNIV